MADITAEQVERAIEAVHADTGARSIETAQAMLRIFGNGWLSVCPRYVAEIFDILVTRPDDFRAALTRWHAELVAAEMSRVLPPWTRVDCDRCGCSHMASRTEPRTVAHGAELLCGECQVYEAGERAAETPHKVARWDGESHWELSPAHTLSNMTVVTACDRAQAIAWGYTIEGGPEPIDDTAPERLRERRERLGWDLDDAADACTAAPGARWHTGNDIARLESREWPIDDAIKAARVRYAAALSAVLDEYHRLTVAIDTTKTALRKLRELRAALRARREAADV